MVSDAVVVAVNPPALVPVIVIVAVVREAFPDALTRSVELVPVTVVGVNVGVTPNGSPVTESVTASVKLPVRVMVTV